MHDMKLPADQSGMPEDAAVSVMQVSENEEIEYLKTEADHFYTAELHAEQRASWLLTAALGALALILNTFVLIQEGKVNGRIGPALDIAVACFTSALCQALLVLWPRRGARNRLFGIRRHAQHTTKAREVSAQQLWLRHYESHRLRAEMRNVHIVRVIIFFILGLLSVGTAVLQNGGVI